MKQILRTDFVRLGENEARSKKKESGIGEEVGFRQGLDKLKQRRVGGKLMRVGVGSRLQAGNEDSSTVLLLHTSKCYFTRTRMSGLDWA